MTTPLDAVPRRPLLSRALVLSIFTAFLLAACATPGPLPGASASTLSSTPDVAVASRPAASAASAPAAEAIAVDVVQAPIAVDPLRPDVRLDLDSRTARIDLWERVRHGFGVGTLDNELVRDNERWYASRPDYVARMTDRGSRYLFHIVEELERRHMPTELALLPFIESAYNPQAMSTARASGMWQFVPATGRDYLLKQNIFRDDRRDVLASTRAALDYLQRLYNMFGDWQLALAAYNWGEGNVQRAIAKNRRAGLPYDYSSLRMPAETQSYVPKLQAVKNIVEHPENFGLTLPPLWNHPYFLAVPIEHDIDVAVAAKLSNMSIEEFQYLNPQMNKPVILAAATQQVLLPYDNANQFVKALPRHRGPLASWTAWVAPKTMRTADAARLVGMSDEHLREVNRIPARMLVKVGSTLVVLRSDAHGADVSQHVADNATMSLAPDAPPLRKSSLKAGRRDSVASVAKRYGVSTAQVAQWNHVSATSGFRPGQTVVVFTAARSARAASSVTAIRVASPSPSSGASKSKHAGSRHHAGRTHVASSAASKKQHVRLATVRAQHTPSQ